MALWSRVRKGQTLGSCLVVAALTVAARPFVAFPILACTSCHGKNALVAGVLLKVNCTLRLQRQPAPSQDEEVPLMNQQRVHGLHSFSCKAMHLSIPSLFPAAYTILRNSLPAEMLV